jgi:hypothetical protein
VATKEILPFEVKSDKKRKRTRSIVSKSKKLKGKKEKADIDATIPSLSPQQSPSLLHLSSSDLMQTSSSSRTSLCSTLAPSTTIDCDIILSSPPKSPLDQNDPSLASPSTPPLSLPMTNMENELLITLPSEEEYQSALAKLNILSPNDVVRVNIIF